ncbi:MAG TPA: MFS transporter [Limnochordales bacterium]
MAFYTVIHYMSLVVVPLYLAREGLSPVVLGMMAAVPGLLMLLVRMPAGVLIDRRGAAWVTLVAVACAAGGGLLLLAAAARWLPTLVAITLAQVMFGTARAAFWPAIRTYMTWWDYRTRAARFGTLNVFEGLGGVGGPIITGVLFAATGPAGTAAVLTLLAALGALAAWRMPMVRPQGAPRGGAGAAARDAGSQRAPAGQPAPAAALSVWRLRPVYLGAACDFSAALTMISLASFLPVYLLVAGLSESLVGLVSSARGLAFAAAGPLYDRWFRKGGYRSAWMAGMGLTGLAFIAVPLFRHPLPLTLAIALMGLGSGILQVLGMVLVADFTPQQQLGLATAYAGMFRSAGVFAVPAVLGVAVDLLGLASAFWLPGAPLLAAAAAHGPILRWGLAQMSGAPAPAGSPAPPR